MAMYYTWQFMYNDIATGATHAYNVMAQTRVEATSFFKRKMANKDIDIISCELIY